MQKGENISKHDRKHLSQRRKKISQEKREKIVQALKLQNPTQSLALSLQIAHQKSDPDCGKSNTFESSDLVAAAMNQSSAEQVQCSKKIQGELAQVEAFVFITILLLGILLLLGALRRRVSSGFLTFVIFVIYTAVSQAIPYIMGLMKSAPFTHEFFPLWASILLLAYGSADNMSAYSLDESQSTAKFLWGFIVQFIWLSLILFLKNTGPDFLFPLIFLIPLMFLKVAERGMALSFANRSSTLESVTMRLADYMKTEHELGQVPDPVTMRGYNYLVDITDVEVKDQKITNGITLENIWECQGRLFSSAGGDALRDTCLSLALFWLLLRKFAGYRLHESSHEKTWKFVLTRLLFNHEADDPAKAFRVIEVELNFLYDYFYTKYFFYFYNRHVMKVLHIVLVLLFGSFTMYNLRNYQPRQDHLRAVFLNLDADVLVTWIMVAALVLLEIVQLCFLVASRWFKVTLLCYYVKQQVWLRRRKLDGCIEKFIETICAIPNSATMLRPWQRKLSQYSLLESYKCVRNDFASRMLYINLRIPIMTMSRKADSVELTPEVVKAVFETLKTNGPRLTNGVTSLIQNRVHMGLSWACQFEMNTDLILAWHVATTLCEFHSPHREATKTNLEVAGKLSKYCAYLVAKAPKLLPDHAHNCKYIYNLVILDAKRLLRECKSPKDVYNKLVVEGIGEEQNPGKVLKFGVKIGKHLINEIREQERMWKVLADFWAELILFLAPSDEELAHAERLAEGGEFITHLWALLIHAGIVSREETNAAHTNGGQDAPDHICIQLNEMPASARFGVYRRSSTA